MFETFIVLNILENIYAVVGIPRNVHIVEFTKCATQFRIGAESNIAQNNIIKIIYFCLCYRYTLVIIRDSVEPLAARDRE